MFLAFLKLRKEDKDINRPYKVPGNEDDKVLLVNKIEKYNHSGKHSKIIKDLKIL